MFQIIFSGKSFPRRSQQPFFAISFSPNPRNCGCVKLYTLQTTQSAKKKTKKLVFIFGVLSRNRGWGGSPRKKSNVALLKHPDGPSRTARAQHLANWMRRHPYLGTTQKPVSHTRLIEVISRLGHSAVFFPTLLAEPLRTVLRRSATSRACPSIYHPPSLTLHLPRIPVPTTPPHATTRAPPGHQDFFL